MQKSFSAKVLILLASSAFHTAHAASFSLYSEGNGVAAGNFAAGIAAEVSDASTGWYNPAGLALIDKQQAVFGGTGVFPTARLTGTSLFTTAPPPLLPPYTQEFNRLTTDKAAFVPFFHYALPVGENLTAGLSLVSPFGLKTQWTEQSPVRYAGTLTELITINIAPEIGGRLSDRFALGGGLDLQYARVKFNSIVGVPTIAQAFNLPPHILDSESYNKGDSFGIGFHIGLLGLFNANHTRFGINYQSQIQQKFRGYSRLTGRLAQPGLNIISPLSIATADPFAQARSNNLSSNTIRFPDILTLSTYHDVNERLALLGSAVYTGWHTFKAIELRQVMAYAPPSPPLLPGRQVLTNASSEENYTDVWRFSLGANYNLDDEWMLRLGGGYDETPVNDFYRSVRIPDTSRWASSVGVRYQPTPQLKVDAGFTHLFSYGSPKINRVDSIGSTNRELINAFVSAYANLVAIQFNWFLDRP